jgi:hypothetical protein
MNIPRLICTFAAALAAAAASADDNTLLIQLDAQGKFVVWHTQGTTYLNDDELAALTASAQPEGGAILATSAGPAQAFQTRDGVVVALKEATRDARLLIDRDDCGGVKVWHGEGETQLSEDDLVELLLTALPGGGRRLAVGENFARGYIARLGVIALLWKPSKRGN